MLIRCKRDMSSANLDFWQLTRSTFFIPQCLVLFKGLTLFSWSHRSQAVSRSAFAARAFVLWHGDLRLILVQRNWLMTPFLVNDPGIVGYISRCTGASSAVSSVILIVDSRFRFSHLIQLSKDPRRNVFSCDIAIHGALPRSRSAICRSARHRRSRSVSSRLGCGTSSMFKGSNPFVLMYATDSQHRFCIHVAHNTTSSGWSFGGG